MCGRGYHTVTDDELEIRYSWLKLKRNPMGLKPNYNLSPTQFCPIIRAQDNENTVDLFKWGLLPSWSKDSKMAYKTFNARAETIDEKPTFKNAFKKHRCVVPLNGYIEWKTDGKLKRPFKFFLRDNPIMSVAGIWEDWQDEKGELVHTFSIITTEANPFTQEIHDRMPVLLADADIDFWLDPKNQDTASLKALLKPAPVTWLLKQEVGTAINSSKNNHPELLNSL